MVHVLVCPRREVKRFVDLTGDETSDLWIVAQKVGKQLEYYHKASSLTFAIQVRQLLCDLVFSSGNITQALYSYDSLLKCDNLYQLLYLYDCVIG